MNKTAVDLYRLLHLPRSASVEQIKVSYRRLAKEYHPDTTTLMDRADAESRFKYLVSAYQVLSNALTKAEYDRSIGNRPVRADVTGGSHVTGGRNVSRSDSRIRSPATGATVSRDLYDVDAWNAHYYGTVLKRESNHSSPFVNYNRNEHESKHQRYYRRKNERDRAGGSPRWNADVAYASFCNDYDSGRQKEDPRQEEQRSADQQSEQHFHAAADSLRRRRNERIQGGGAHSGRSHCIVR